MLEVVVSIEMVGMEVVSVDWWWCVDGDEDDGNEDDGGWCRLWRRQPCRGGNGDGGDGGGDEMRMTAVVVTSDLVAVVASIVVGGVVVRSDGVIWQRGDDGVSWVSAKDYFRMDDPSMTMEEYFIIEEEKARKRGKVFNWQTATYGKIRIDDDLHDFSSLEAEFPAIVINDAFAPQDTFQCKSQ
ncbi:hypothetical protein Tco_0383370 [Tanacetum coccineum]